MLGMMNYQATIKARVAGGQVNSVIQMDGAIFFEA
jgi:hypothetical protein